METKIWVKPPPSIPSPFCPRLTKINRENILTSDYIVRRILARKGTKMELAPNNWKPMPHCSLWSSVIPKKSLLLHRLGGALFGGSKPPRFQFLFFIKINHKRWKKKVTLQIKVHLLAYHWVFYFLF